MPYFGLHSFLQMTMLVALSLRGGCVNALHRALPISTRYCIKDLQNALVVSMPYIGLPSFLRYPSRTNDFSVCSNPKFAHVFELGPFFLFFRLIFGFFEFFSKSPQIIPQNSYLYYT